MPQPDARKRPSPFLFLLLGSAVLKLAAAMYLAFGIVQLYVAIRLGPKLDWKLGFAHASAATWLVIECMLIFALGDASLALVDIHRDLRISRELLERSHIGPAPSTIQPMPTPHVVAMTPATHPPPPPAPPAPPPSPPVTL